MLYQISFSLDGEQVQVMKYTSTQDTPIAVLLEFFAQMKIELASLKGIGIVRIGG